MSESGFRNPQMTTIRGVLVLSVTQPHLRSIQFDTADELRDDMLSAVDEV